MTSLFVFELRVDVYVDLAFDTPFSTRYNLFIASRNGKSTSSRQSLHAVAVYVQAQSCQADDRSRRDFWLMVL